MLVVGKADSVMSGLGDTAKCVVCVCVCVCLVGSVVPSLGSSFLG